jgi:hypothetical protein
LRERAGARNDGPRRSQPGRGDQDPLSQLSEDEKQRLRTWADKPNARRIGDARVQQWTEAGKP